MRIVNPRVLVLALALVALACAHRPCASHHGEPCMGHGGGMAMAGSCGTDACAYASRCFSSGAVRSNDGACQACDAGKWVSATGCRPGATAKKSGPCDHERHEHSH